MSDELRKLQQRTRHLDDLLAEAQNKSARAANPNTTKYADSPNPIQVIAQAVDTNAEELRRLIALEHAAIESRLEQLGLDKAKDALDALTMRVSGVENCTGEFVEIKSVVNQVESLISAQQREAQQRYEGDERIRKAIQNANQDWREREANLMEKVNSTIFQYRQELDNVVSQQQWVRKELEQRQDHLLTMGTSGSGGQSVSDAVVHSLREELVKRSEEAEVLRLAILSDRMERESSSVAQQREQAYLLNQLDELKRSHDELRVELEQHRMDNKKVMDSIGECPRMRDLYQSVVEDLKRVKSEQAVLLQGVDTLTKYVEYETTERRDEHRKLLSTLDQLTTTVGESTWNRAPLQIKDKSSAKVAKRRSSRQQQAISKKCYVDPGVLMNTGRVVNGAVVVPDVADEFVCDGAQLNHERRIRANMDRPVQTPYIYYHMDSIALQTDDVTKEAGTHTFSQTNEKSSADGGVGGIESQSRSTTMNEPSAYKVQKNDVTEGAAEVMAALVAFYTVYNPNKLNSIGGILTEYAGATEELYEALEAQYDAFGFFRVREMLTSQGMRAEEVSAILTKQKGAYDVLLRQLRSSGGMSPHRASLRMNPYLTTTSASSYPTAYSSSPADVEAKKQQLQSEMESLRQNAATLVSKLGDLHRTIV